MRLTTLFAVALAAACSKQPGSAQAASVPAQPAASDTSADTALRGKVAEKIDASQYSYLRLETKAGDVWAAVPKSKVEVGTQATVVGAMWMQDFKSATLNRTFSRIAFGTLEGESSGAPAPVAAAPRPAGGPAPAFSGMFAQEAARIPSAQQAPGAQAQPVAQTPHTTAPAPEAPIAPMPKAQAREGRTIAEIYAHRTALKDHKVVVRAKVVKEVDGVMGKNWLHLRDGTGKGAAADLAVASDGTAAVGDTVLMTGIVHLDRDLGAGYRYDILVEEAKVEKE